MGNNKPQEFCPYKGLQPYEENDREYFFGRENDIDIIISNLCTSPLTVLYGGSGVGKSSVLLAGVVPKLRHEPQVVVVFREWQSQKFETSLKEATLAALHEKYPEHPIGIDISLPLERFLRKCSRRSAEIARERNNVAGGLCFVLDQFEEYFVYHPASHNGDDTQHFDAQFALAVNRGDIKANFLLAMRDDGLSKLDRFQGRIPHILNNLLRLEHLDQTAALSAICRPLIRYNAKTNGAKAAIDGDDGYGSRNYEPSKLVARLLEDLKAGRVKPGHGYVAPLTSTTDRIETPYLQMVLTRLWDARNRESNRLELSTYETLGGAEEIVKSHLDKVMSEQVTDDNERDVAARLFEYLVTPDGGKIALSVKVLAGWIREDPSKVDSVISILSGSDVRILRSVESGPGSSGPMRYEIFHDVLAPAIADWRTRRLQIIAEREAQEKAQREAAERAAKELQEAQKLAAEQEKDLHRAQQIAEYERKRATLEQQKAELEFRGRISQARAAKWSRIAAILLLGFSIFAVAATVYAVKQQQQAVSDKGVAEKAKVKAENAEVAALEAAEESVKAKKTAEAAKLDLETALVDANKARERALRAEKEAQIQKSNAIGALKNAEDERDKAKSARTGAEKARNAFHLAKQPETRGKAIENLREALAVYQSSKEASDADAATDTLLSMGEVNVELGNETEAVKSFTQALKRAKQLEEHADMLKKIGDIYMRSPAQDASSFSSLSFWSPLQLPDAPVNKAQQRVDKAIASYEAALEAYRLTRDRSAQGDVLVKLALAYDEKNRNSYLFGAAADESNKRIERTFREAREAYAEAQNRHGSAFALFKEAVIKRRKNPNDPAVKELLESALTAYADDLQGKIQVTRELISVYQYVQNKDERERATNLTRELASHYHQAGDYANEANILVYMTYMPNIAGLPAAQAYALKAPLLKEAANRYVDASQPRSAIKVLLELVQVHRNADQREAAAKTLDTALLLATEIDLETQVLGMFVDLFAGTNEQKAREYLQKLETRVQQMLAAPSEAYKIPQKAEAFFHLGRSHLILRMDEAAANDFRQLTDLYRDAQDAYGEASALQRIAWLYSTMSRPDEAIANFENAANTYHQAGDLNAEAMARVYLASSYITKRDYSRAIAAYNSSLNYYRASKQIYSEGSVLAELSKTYRTLNQPEQAVKHLEAAINIYREAKYDFQEAPLLVTLGETYVGMNNRSKAIEAYERAATLYEGKDRFLQAKAYIEIAKIYETAGDQRKASEYKKKASELAPNLFPLSP